MTALSTTGARRADDTLRLAVLVLDSDLDPDPDLLVDAAEQSSYLGDLALARRLGAAAVRAANVLAAQPLTWTCSYVSGRSSAWKPIGTGDLNNDGNQDVTWFNRGTGEVSSWLTNGSGTVLGTQSVDWHCDYASGCASAWGIVDLVR